MSGIPELGTQMAASFKNLTASLKWYVPSHVFVGGLSVRVLERQHIALYHRVACQIAHAQLEERNETPIGGNGFRIPKAEAYLEPELCSTWCYDD